jgi:hypothetical protein
VTALSTDDAYDLLGYCSASIFCLVRYFAINYIQPYFYAFRVLTMFGQDFSHTNLSLHFIRCEGMRPSVEKLTRDHCGFDLIFLFYFQNIFESGESSSASHFPAFPEN